MKFTTVLRTSMVLPLVALLALAGCGGGGGGGTAMNTGGPESPGTGGQPGTGTGGQPGTEPPTLPPATPRTPTLAELVPDPANMFGTFSKGLRLDSSAGRSSVSNRFSISSVASDGDSGFHVTYVVDGTEETVHFSKADFGTRDSTSYTKDVGGRQYWLWGYSGGYDGVGYGIGSEFLYFDLFGSHHPSGGRIHTIYGVPTGSSGMPTGTAAYSGRMFADQYDNTVGSTSSRVARGRVQGNLVLTADFADATLSGRIFRLRIQPPGESSYENMPSTTRFDIADGAIAGDGFTATLTGVDDDANAPLEDSMRGFTGDISGRFYGPNAHEFGAVFTAARATDATDDSAILGHLGGRRTDVVGEHMDNEPLQAGVNRLDYSSASPRVVAQDANNRITSIEADDAGGYTVSYLVDGTPQTVSLGVDDLGSSTTSRDAYRKRTGTLSAWLRRPGWLVHRVPQGLHYNVKDWSLVVYPDGTSTSLDSGVWASVVHGTRTASTSMPQTGMATYAGRASAYVFEPSPGEGRASSNYAEGYSGSLTLSADFAAGSVSGRISDLEHSPTYFNSGTYSAAAGEFTISNGAIQGNALSGTLTSTVGLTSDRSRVWSFQ